MKKLGAVLAKRPRFPHFTPWAILGYVAALRGETPLAVAKTRSIEQLFASNRSLVTINELGFYLRTQSVLAGQVDV
jgi:hypothetical protein